MTMLGTTQVVVWQVNGVRFAQSAKAQVDQLLSQSQLDRLVDPIEADRGEDQSLDQILVANNEDVHISYHFMTS